MQAGLNHHSGSALLAEDGIYGPTTRAAVSSWQVAMRGAAPGTPASDGVPGVHDFLHGQAAVHVELRGDPQLGVDHAVPGEILHGLAGDAGQRRRGLRDGRGVGERLEVRGQAARVSGLHEPAGDLLGITGGQGIVTRPIGELDESGGTHPAGQMIVEDHLRQISNDTRLDLLGIEGHLG